jgi:hypothetical protein
MMSPQAGMAMTTLQGIPPLIFLIVATTLEVSGDAVIRKGLFNHSGLACSGARLHSCARSPHFYMIQGDADVART